MWIFRIIITLCAAYFFVIFLPIALTKYSLSIDTLNVDELISRFFTWRIVGVLGLSGLMLSLWTVFIQVKQGLGTPLPVMPPKKLLINAPYTYCRNPMALGALVYYLGICIFIGSVNAFLLVISVFVILIVWIKFGEEVPLENKFGQEYIEYKQRTPFLIPRIFGKRWYFLFLR